MYVEFDRKEIEYEFSELPELDLAYALNRNREKAIQAFRAGIEQHRNYADCYYYLCKALRTGPEAREACRLYLKIEPRGTFASDARQWTD